jgi:hypothetical protein
MKTYENQVVAQLNPLHGGYIGYLIQNPNEDNQHTVFSTGNHSKPEVEAKLKRAAHQMSKIIVWWN